jgi:hypothetical protein
MRQLEIDPEIADALDAIDATLAGEPVDPRHAELAELALLLTADRPAEDPAFARTLDERVAGRFTAAKERRRRRRRLLPFQVGGAAAAALAASVAVVVALGSLGGSGSSSGVSSAAATRAVASSAAATTSAAASASAPGVHRLSARNLAAESRLSPDKAAAASSDASIPAAPSGSTSAGPDFGGPQPLENGRKTIQTAQLSLSTPPDHLDDVSQGVLNVVGQERGIVKQSSVTATGGADGNAYFVLSIPTANLAQTMTRLSDLPGAQVSSRTDSSQDVNDQYNSDVRRLADAQALRRSLLKQLAAATTQSQIDSLKAQIKAAEAQIASDQGTLNLLGQHISFSQLQVTIQPNGKTSTGPAFTIDKATHDAGRVLTVVAGVALIALAALAPVALLALLAWWIGAAIRRRRRDQALDIA